MAEKRKDKAGRILRTGENQRKNGTYEYRYSDGHRKVRSIYAKTLEELRKKAGNIQRDMADGIDYAAGEITVPDLVDRYMNLKRDLSENTRRGYGTVINRIKESDFGQMRVRTVKISDAKAFYISLHDRGNKRNTISIFQARRKILCKRFSTKSRMALESRADSGLNPLITESHGGQNGMRAGTA